MSSVVMWLLYKIRSSKMLFCQYLTIQREFKIGKGIEVEENDAEGLHL